MADTNPAGAGQQPMGQLSIQKIYIKDLSFEAPNSPGVFTEQLNPSVDIHFANEATDLGEDQHEEGHHQRRAENTGLAEGGSEQRGGQRGRQDVHEVVAEQDRADQTFIVVCQRERRARAA